MFSVFFRSEIEVSDLNASYPCVILLAAKMDTATFLTIVIILVALVLVAIGVYLILLLHEARHSLRKINKMLDRIDNAADFVEEKIINPTANITNVFTVVKEGIDFFRDLKRTVRPKNSPGRDYDDTD